jgi:hypothetical protein
MNDKISFPWIIQKPQYVARAISAALYSAFVIETYLTETVRRFWPEGFLTIVLVTFFSITVFYQGRFSTLICMKNGLKRFCIWGHRTIPWKAIKEVRLRKTQIRSPRIYILLNDSNPVCVYPRTLSKNECREFLDLLRRKISSKKVSVDRQLLKKFFKKG